MAIVTRRDLQNMVDRLSRVTESPPKAYIKESRDAQCGAYVLDFAACYGGYALHRITNTGGGVTVVNRHIKERMTNKEMQAFLGGMLKVLEDQKYGN